VVRSERDSNSGGRAGNRLPSLDLLRQLTDRHVFEELVAEQPLTRAEIAAHTGISKPTISESVRRLLEADIVAESGRQVGKRGPAGTYLTLRPGLAVAMAVSAGPDGVVAQTFDLRNNQLADVTRPVQAPIQASLLEPVILSAARAAADFTAAQIRSCAVSVAAPIDQRTGRPIQLPHAPFLLGELSPRDLLSEVVTGEIAVDNDVNWAALAELREGQGQGLKDFLLCYLGAGIGGAAVVAGAVTHGHRGLAGELAHILTAGPGGRSMSLHECFAAWDLLQPGSDAIDTARVLDVFTGSTESSRRQGDAIATGVAGMLASATALVDPEAILIAGPWGRAPGFVDEVADRLPAALHPQVRPAALAESAPLTGARLHAVQAARNAVVAGL
jgi:predicted NBD/HSP70 family sugar kinase